MRLDRTASVAVAAPLLNSGLLQRACGIPILMYHSVSWEQESVRPYFRLTVSPRRFREQMKSLRERGFSVIALSEAVRRIQSAEPIPPRTVVITFDDGFRDFATAAWPILEEYRYTATVFLPTGFIRDKRASFLGRECLTWSEVRTLHANGITFGTHTVDHPKLHDMSWEEIHGQLSNSRQHLQNQLPTVVRAFAYPFAFPQEDRPFAHRFRLELERLGYESAVTTIVGRARQGDEVLQLPRLPVNEGDDELLLVSKLEGAYDWVGTVQALVRHVKRCYRRSA
jgi:peptidoglycan/xylan/chitin deacetylase (PgdA/CDA1 family)